MEDKSILLEQYKLFVNSADGLTSRRLDTNKFYLAILLGLFSIAGFLNTKEMSGVFDKEIILAIISVLGVSLSIVWYMNIESYRLLNSAKFKVIHEIEEQLAYPCFDREWQFRKGATPSKAYPRFTQIEKFVPIMMGIIFIVILVVGVII